uniref:Kinesin motor domain-containing protein n=1 Tax=Equus caballus TaxID=9796 RepID=A0A3Q2GY80_HORSE
MVKQTIQIFARVKPTVRKQPQGIYSIDEDEKLTPSLEIILPRDLADGFVNNKRENYRFKFQRIFDQDANQETIFESIAKPVAERRCWKGIATFCLSDSCLMNPAQTSPALIRQSSFTNYTIWQAW